MSQFQWQSRKPQPGAGGGTSFTRPGQLAQNVVALNELKFTLHQRLIEELGPTTHNPIDRAPVTNAQFTRFVREMGYVTIAEQPPRAEDYPGAIPEMPS